MRGSVVTTNRVILDVNFAGTNASQIPDGRWLGGVASVAGGNGLTTTGWVYQNGVALFNDNDVIWAPQAWYNGVIPPGRYYSKWVGTGDYVSFYERIDIGSGSLVYRAYVYQDFLQGERDAPTIYSYWHPTNDSNFLVGRRTHLGYPFKHFQFGVESNTRINETAWRELNNHASYYNGTNWLYLPGYVTWGTTSYITWIGTLPYGVGGEVYTGVNEYYAGRDMVCWSYNGTTIPDDSQLWSESGIVSDTVSKPYIPRPHKIARFYPILDGFIRYRDGVYDGVCTYCILAAGEEYSPGLPPWVPPTYWWWRTFLRFNFSSIPTGSTINSATFYAYYFDHTVYGGGEGICELAHIEDIGSSLDSGDWDNAVLHDYGEFCDRSEGYGYKSKDVTSSLSSPFGLVSYRLKGSIEDSDKRSFYSLLQWL